ncbi:histidine phosphatase family protein [Tumebacillus sp. ITR2]|uniref:Histidine phosphatase family protein n=1 Tax=Tumebacillus amylolyticus TaxID=2801339 RepID=A0ABS1J6B1_9BACL|nr:histidine phosphatase family protein [Tumebacillus amylolyticus]MBL0385821.1 histidine phosphatase family protein [Tumebacillus amylolyticus]
MTHVLFVRHGETDGNARRQYIGRTDLPLNEKGVEQIQRLQEKLSLELREVAQVFHSPLMRTTQTAALLLGNDLLAHADPRLAELDFGEWEAKSYNDLEAEYHDHLWRWYDDPWNVAPPNGETLQDLDARLTAWHESIVRSIGTTLVVSHGGPIRLWYAKYVLQELTRFHSLHLPPGGFVHVRRTGDGWQLVQGEITAP